MFKDLFRRFQASSKKKGIMTPFGRVKVKRRNSDFDFLKKFYRGN